MPKYPFRFVFRGRETVWKNKWINKKRSPNSIFYFLCRKGVQQKNLSISLKKINKMKDLFIHFSLSFFLMKKCMYIEVQCVKEVSCSLSLPYYVVRQRERSVRSQLSFMKSSQHPFPWTSATWPHWEWLPFRQVCTASSNRCHSNTCYC